MKRLIRILVISAAVLAVLLAGGMWYLNRWLTSPETRALVEKELSKALKMPLTFQALDISVWGGVHAEGISVQDGGTRFFESSSFTAKHRLTPLLSGKFVFSEITIDSPRCIMVQRPDGSWRLPQLPQEAKPKVAQSTEPKGPKPATPKPKEKEARVHIEKLVVSNGQVDFYDKEHKPVASAAGVTISLKDVSEHSVEGRVKAARVVWNGIMGLSDFSAGVSNSKEKGLIIPNFVAKAGGGTIEGGYSRKPEKPAKYSVKVRLTDVDINQAIADGEVPAPNIEGKLSGNIELKGTGDDTKLMNGKAILAFKDGNFRDLEFYRDIGTKLGMEELANFNIPEAKADIVVWNGRLKVQPITISAPPLALKATGTAKLDGKLDLDAQLFAHSDFVAKRGMVAAQFGPPDAAGMRAVPFEVDGTLTKPKHNLAERLTGTKDKRVQQVMAFDEALRLIAPPSKSAPPPAAPAGRQTQQ